MVLKTAFQKKNLRVCPEVPFFPEFFVFSVLSVYPVGQRTYCMDTASYGNVPYDGGN
jgi:hypothetical protein